VVSTFLSPGIDSQTVSVAATGNGKLAATGRQGFVASRVWAMVEEERFQGGVENSGEELRQQAGGWGNGNG
jgi:hypothetical protein